MPLSYFETLPKTEVPATAQELNALGVIAFVEDLPAKTAEEVNTKAQEIFYKAQKELSDFLELKGLVWEMGIIFPVSYN